MYQESKDGMYILKYIQRLNALWENTVFASRYWLYQKHEQTDYLTACSPHDRKLDLFCEGNFSYKDLEIMLILLPVSNNAATFVPLIMTSMYIKSPTVSSTESHIFTSLTLLTHSPALLVFTPQTFGADPEPGAISFPNFLISYTHPHCVLFVDKFGR